jgi:hypothetical protein
MVFGKVNLVNVLECYLLSEDFVPEKVFNEISEIGAYSFSLT